MFISIKRVIKKLNLINTASKNAKDNFLSREINSSYIGISFTNFVNLENNKSPLAAWSYQELYAGNAPAYWLDFKIDYYYFCFTNNCLETEKLNIIKLWKGWLVILERREIDESLFGILLNLAKITRDSKICDIQKNNFDSEILTLISHGLSNELEQDTTFTTAFTKIIKWYDFRINKYIPCMEIGYSYYELKYLKNLYDLYPDKISIIKAEKPNLFLKFSSLYRQLCYLYNCQEKRTTLIFLDTEKAILLDTISLCSTLGILERMSSAIYAYNKIIYKKRPITSWLLDFFIGYGEKPFRIIKLILLYHILFLLLFLIPIFEFNNLPANISWEKIISIAYFNNTTMLTVGYGDIYPNDILTKFVVSMQQIFGFLITGSFITLSLRKMFRF